MSDALVGVRRKRRVHGISLHFALVRLRSLPFLSNERLQIPLVHDVKESHNVLLIASTLRVDIQLYLEVLLQRLVFLLLRVDSLFLNSKLLLSRNVLLQFLFRFASSWRPFLLLLRLFCGINIFVYAGAASGAILPFFTFVFRCPSRARSYICG